MGKRYNGSDIILFICDFCVIAPHRKETIMQLIKDLFFLAFILAAGIVTSGIILLIVPVTMEMIY